MNKGDFLFVYGTLRRGQRASLQREAHKFDVKFCGEDRINGRMYHLGAYPGVKRIGHTVDFQDNQPLISGEIFFIKHPSVVALMDAYEGYNSDDPRLGLFNRVQVEAESGKMVWVYLYNPPVTSDQLITSGDWCRNPDMPVRARGLRA